jgi:hypothetical protein
MGCVDELMEDWKWLRNSTLRRMTSTLIVPQPRVRLTGRFIPS